MVVEGFDVNAGKLDVVGWNLDDYERILDEV